MKNTSIASTLGFLCIALTSTGLTMEEQNHQDMNSGLPQVLAAAPAMIDTPATDSLPITQIGGVTHEELTEEIARAPNATVRLGQPHLIIQEALGEARLICGG
jgi:hypothetical protein